ncbi:MAG: substrate-binding domain-containing protein [Tannerella sp.]|jgi:signal transduction histidine kinase/DNA-binding response OmpR family regulator|nr:substrate-binding domain-containing protein [Tannerella sp.]
MKSTVNLFLFTLFLLAFASCRQEKSQYTIGVSQCSDDEWRSKMNMEMRNEALFHKGVRLDIKTVNDDTKKQIADIQGFIDRRVDLIVISPNQAEPVTPIVEKVYSAGIPVVLVDRKIASDKYTAFIGADNVQIGQEVGHYVAKLLNGKGNVVEIRGLNGSSSDAERHRGFTDIIKNYPEIKTVASTDGAWLKNVAEREMSKILSETTDSINLVFSHNDRMATGAYNAAKRIGYATQFIGIDALPGAGNGIESVLDGRLKASFIYPTSGDKIIQLAVDILQGKPYRKQNTLYTNLVDETNVRVLKLQTDAIIEQENKISALDRQIDSHITRHATQQYLLLVIAFVCLTFITLSILLYKAYNSKLRLSAELERNNHLISSNRAELELQRDQLIALSQELEKATQAKLVFFTNISHEFRTPLTLIAGPVASLLADKSLLPNQQRLLTMVQKNVGILLRLIDQIIDFRKYENGKLILDMSENDLYQQMTEWNGMFCELGVNKRLRFDFSVKTMDSVPVEDAFHLYYDPEKIERIYFNLLSNAFKFTPERGFISVTLEKTNRSTVVIRISNSGKGISKSNIQNIFDRFYQVDSHVSGSGIGLALTKALVELHGGEISADSNETTGITTFTIVLPFFQNGMDTPVGINNKSNELSIPQSSDTVYLKTNNTEPDTVSETGDNRETVLVIDDNPDIRTFIKTILQNNYAIMEAEDGAGGFRKAVHYIPDIIVSDIMMPPPDGLELCRRLKNEISTSHIPVILLTAYSLDEYRISGYKNGADAYIAKPFNSDMLEVRIRNLIENRRHLKDIYRQNILSGEKNIPEDLDKIFMDKFRGIVENRFQESDLNVEDLSLDAGLSYTQLYRKIKALTGYTPNELLKIIRLQKAHQLLSPSGFNVSEIAYKTGFTSPSYFAKCFKDFYGESPSDYVKRIS